MPPVTLHQPVEGLDRGAKYTGPREEWLVANGYASRDGEAFDGLHATTTDAENDPLRAENRDEPQPAEEPTPTADTTDVAVDTDRYEAPEVDLNPEQPKGVQEKLKAVEDGERDALSPDVKAGAFREALQHDRETAGEGDPEIRARVESATPPEEDDEAVATRRSEARVEAAKAAREADKDAMRGEHNPAASSPAKSEDREDGTNAETRILTAEEASQEERRTLPADGETEPQQDAPKRSRRARKDADEG